MDRMMKMSVLALAVGMGVLSTTEAMPTVMERAAPQSVAMMQVAAPGIQGGSVRRTGDTLERIMGEYNIDGKRIPKTGKYYTTTAWFIEGNSNPVAWGPRYILKAADAGKSVYYSETITDPKTKQSRTFKSYPVKIISAGAPSVRAMPAIKEAGQVIKVGTTLNRVMGRYTVGGRNVGSDAPGTDHYFENTIWLVNNKVVGYGPRYTVKRGDDRKKIRYEEHIVNHQTKEKSVYASAEVEIGSVIQVEQRPKIQPSGSVKPGTKLNRVMGQYRIGGRLVGRDTTGTDHYFENTVWIADGKIVGYGPSYTVKKTERMVHYEEHLRDGQTGEKLKEVSENTVKVNADSGNSSGSGNSGSGSGNAGGNTGGGTGSGNTGGNTGGGTGSGNTGGNTGGGTGSGNTGGNTGGGTGSGNTGGNTGGGTGSGNTGGNTGGGTGSGNAGGNTGGGSGSGSTGGSNAGGGTGSGNSGQSSAYLLEQAIASVGAGNDIHFPGWGDDQNKGKYGCRRAQQCGGAVVLGGLLRLGSPEIGYAMEPYVQKYKRIGKSDPEATRLAAIEYNRDKDRYFDRISPWGVFVPGRNNKIDRAYVNMKNFKVFVLLKGENTWKPLVRTSEAPATWANVFLSDMQTAKEDIPISYAQGYQVTQLGYSLNVVNHWGAGDLPVLPGIDLSKVEGMYAEIEARLDPRNPTAEVALQLGVDGKHSWRPLPWYVGFGLTKLTKLTPEWKKVTWVNASTGQDAMGGRSITPERIKNTTLPK